MNIEHEAIRRDHIDISSRAPFEPPFPFSSKTEPKPTKAGPTPSPNRRNRFSLPAAIRALAEAQRTLFYVSAYLLSYGVRLYFARDKELLRATLLRSFLIRMGPLYMKVGQVFGTQTGLISKAAADQFRVFFADLPYQNPKIVNSVLERSLPKGSGLRLRSFEQTPVAVGSVAQVHRATLSDGREVAVKIVKRGVRERLEAGSTVWLLVLRLLHYLSGSFRRLNLPAHFRELKPLLASQCDMLLELHNINIVKANFVGHPYVVIPTPVQELCSEDVLVMEFMSGIAGQDFAKCSFPLPQLARRVQDVFYTMVYFNGVFHVDPHPGNFILEDSGRLVLLDFGLVGTLNEEDKWTLSAFHYACIRGDWNSAIVRFTNGFVVHSPKLHDRFAEYREQMSAVLLKHYVDRTSRWSTMSFFDDANKLLQRYESRFSTRFSLLAISMLTGEGFISQIDPAIDVWNNARKFMDRYSPYMSGETKLRFDEFFHKQIPNSLKRRNEAAGVLVAPTHFDRYVLPSVYPLVIAEAKGSKLRDIDGNTYIDLSCGYGPHILGYAHPGVVRAVSESIAHGAINAIGSEPQIRLAQLLTDAFPGATKALFVNSGTESAITAFRLARAFTGKNAIAKFEGHYHGFSDQGMISSWFRFTGQLERPQPFQGSPGTQLSVVNETVVLQYGSHDSLRFLEKISGDVAGVILEPMPAATCEYDANFLAALRDVCSKHNIVLIFDEVVSGFRVAYGGVQNLVNVHPDITCLGKIIGGGLPCGAVVGREEIIDMAKTTGDPFRDLEVKAFAGGTLSGNSVTCAAGEAVLQELRGNPDIYEKLARNSEWLVTAFSEQASARRIPNNIKGNRSIFSITFDYAKPRSIRQRLAGSNFKANMALAYYMRKHGVYVPELHTMMLSAAHDQQDLDLVVRAFGQSLDEMLSDGYFTL